MTYLNSKSQILNPKSRETWYSQKYLATRANCCMCISSIKNWGTWVAQSVKLLTSAQVMILWSLSWSPVSGFVLTAWILERALDSLSPSLSLSAHPPLVLSLCLSKN